MKTLIQDLEKRADRVIREMLAPQNRILLEKFRLSGSTNRVYRFPLDSESTDFIVVKLLPGPCVRLKIRAKCMIRNLLYKLGGSLF